MANDDHVTQSMMDLGLDLYDTIHTSLHGRDEFVDNKNDAILYEYDPEIINEVFEITPDNNNERKVQETDNNAINNENENQNEPENKDYNPMIDTLNTVMKTMNNKKLNKYTDKIAEYFTQNNIDYIKLKSMARKPFMVNVSEYCGDKKIKTPLGKLLKALTEHIKNEHKEESKQTDEDVTKGNNVDSKIADNEQNSNDTNANNENHNENPMIDTLNNAMETLNNTKLNKYTEQITAYFTTNSIDYYNLESMGSKPFMLNVSKYCGDKKIKVPLRKLFTALTEQSKQTDIQTKVNKALGKQISDEHKDQSKQTEEEITNENNVDSKMVDDLIKQIDAINEEKLNENKKKIIEYFKQNDIDYKKLQDLGRKAFMADIARYCGDSKMQPKLGKLFNALNDPKSTEKRSSSAIFAGDMLSEIQKFSATDAAVNDLSVINSEPQKAQIKAPSQMRVQNEEIKEQKPDGSDDESDYEDYEEQVYREEQMPTYINRAIWYRSDDENLERLVDRSVKKLLQLDDLWTDSKFVERIYDETQFEENVNIIFQKHFYFFSNFVRSTFERELLLDALKQEVRCKKKQDEESTDAKDEVKEALERGKQKDKPTHIVFYHHDNEYKTLRHRVEHKEEEKENEINYMSSDDEEEIAAQRKSRQCGYHIYAMDAAPVKGTAGLKEEVTRLYVDDAPPEFEWAVWKRKRSGGVWYAAKQRRQDTFGYWEVLNREGVIARDISGKSRGVPLQHLNAIFELFRVYYTQRILMINKTSDQTKSQTLLGLKELDDDIIRDAYCTKFNEQKKVNIPIFIHEGYKGGGRKKIHYQLIWWNCKKRTECNAFAIKNLSAYPRNKDIKDMKEKYYMRYNVSDVKYDSVVGSDENEGIKWYWYDNDLAKYQTFSDYVTVSNEKKGLLHKQIEATYQANIDSNYSWEIFDKSIQVKGKKQQMLHSFNGAQLTHLKPALVSNIGRNVSTVGYLARFTRLSFRTAGKGKDDKSDESNDEKSNDKPKRKQKRISLKHDTNLKFMDQSVAVNLILNMEQVAVHSNNLFPRNLKRTKDGQNSLDDQYSGSAPFVNAWVKTYYLSTEAQQKYFWSYILCICAKIKQMDIEIENQLVTIPLNNTGGTQSKSLFSNTSEVAQEQQDALLYKGFLVPPVLGEAITDEINKVANAKIDDIRESIEKLSKTRILTKGKVTEQWLVHEDDRPFVYFHDKDDDQYLEDETNIFRFAEIVRKFIIEDKHLNDDTSLWPYYKNYAHKKDYATYHTMVNRFNLTLMFSKREIFQVFDEKDDELIGCWDHLSRKDVDENGKNEKEESSNQMAIRHRRKYAATLLLQKWNTLRNLNILRQQLTVIFNEIIENEEKQSQKQMLDEAKKFDENEENHEWKVKITEINKNIQSHINSKKTGWQYLIEHDLKGNKTLEISIKQYPLFESFCRRFLFRSVKEKKRKLGQDLACSPWYSQFKQSWVLTPAWWSCQHDLILLELALKHNIDHVQYINDLKGEKAADFRMRLKDRSAFLEFQHFCEQMANVLHRLKYITNLLVDNLTKIKPSLVDIRVPQYHDNEDEDENHGFVFSEYERTTHQEYVARQLPQVAVYKPTSKHKKIVDKSKQAKYREIMDPVMESLILNMRDAWPVPAAKTETETEKETGIKLIMQKSVEALQFRKEQNKMDSQLAGGIELGQQHTLIPSPKPMAITGDASETKEEKYEIEEKHQTDSKQQLSVESVAESLFSDDEDESAYEVDMEKEQKKKKKTKKIVDPFIARDLEMELYEVINSFDMIRYGREMAKLVINEIKDDGMDQLWTILGVVMEAIPFSMALEILDTEIDTLKRGKPQQMKTLCLHMVDGTNWRISSALRMAQYFESIADIDEFQHDEWTKISQNFENIAHKSIKNIESDHLLYALLTIPLYDTSQPMSIIKLALEQHRISFLNNERILTLIKYIWHNGASVYIEDDIKDVDMSFTDLLPTLFFTPFRFYLSPVGYNHTLSILFLLYLGYVLLYSKGIVVGRVNYAFELTLWILNLGYILYEVSEWLDKGREYFSVSGLMNVWDIMISVVWIALFVINRFVLGAFSIYPDKYENIKDLIDDNESVELKIYTLLFGFQIFLLSTRFLTLFQNTEYLGGLLKIVQMMAKEIAKFLSVAMVTIAAFTFGFYFIYGLENLTDPDESPQEFWTTILFSFDLFIGGGTNNESTVGAVFTIILTVIGMLILTNLLIALMTTEYEKFQEKAQEEVGFMRIETTIDLAHRDRLFPPPLNVIVYPIGIIVHVLTIIFAMFSCKSICKCNCNLYSHISRNTYLCLNTCYCGCNKTLCRKFEAKRKAILENAADDWMIQEKLYEGKCHLLRELTGYSFIKNKIMYRIKKICKWLGCKCCPCKCCAKTYKLKKKYKLNPLSAYHKGCYNCIKLRVKDEFQKESDKTKKSEKCFSFKSVKRESKTTVRGISMKEYITKYESIHETQLNLADVILLKHLTVDTLFCNYCYQPYLERQVDKSLMAPSRVVLDVISCIVFLFTAWLPLVVLFILMAIFEYLQQCCSDNVKSQKSDGGNKYEEFDREYFPHPEKQAINV